MINSENGRTRIKGNGSTLLADLSGIVRALLTGTDGVLTKEHIEDAVKIGLMPDEERKAYLKEQCEAIDALEKLIDAAKKFMDEPDTTDTVATMDANLVRDIFGKE